MSNPGCLTAGRAIDVNAGVYIERADPKDSALEEFLRGWVAKMPRLRRQGRSSPLTEAAARHESAVRALDDIALAAQLFTVCKPLVTAGFRQDLTAHAFALVREAGRRALGMRHHDVQLRGAFALLQGHIAEMATGEGKTLVATLAACTAAAAGAAVHVVTVNDYLAARDAETNLPLYAFFGLSVGIVKQDMTPADRRQQYDCNIVYVSNKELVFDYLKDRIAVKGTTAAHLRIRKLYRTSHQASTLLRGLHMAIVDEADSVLIDEARTPLIISETLPDELGPEVYQTALDFAGRMQAGIDYATGKDREIWLLPAGERNLAQWAADAGAANPALSPLWHSALWRHELVQKGLSALHNFKRDQHYIIAENKVQIVDEFTGRVMPDRSWERGLHQMIEAKEGAEITGQRKTLAQMTYQRFFRRYLLLCGMTGTAKEVEPELKRIYDLSVTKIPTHKPSRRQRLADACFATSAERWQAVAARAAQLAAQGRAVLVGTRSIEASETLSNLLTTQGIAHTVLNARQDKTEADTVAQAGEAGRITVATNMAGRGTDIKPNPAASAAGGLHVILTEFHESARIDRQLFGRSARQGEAGTVEAYVAVDDGLFTRYAPLVSRWLARVLTQPTAPGQRTVRGLAAWAQGKAERYTRSVRLETVKQDKKFQESMGFVGRD